MPKRTTPFQMVVFAVRRQLAEPGVAVTESKMLSDARGMEREVDVVIEGQFDGDSTVTSVEIIEHGRPGTVTWVEQVIAKHRYLPTNRLILVSKSGFSKSALTAVAAEGGWVDAVRPEIVEVDGTLRLKDLFVDEIALTPTICRMHVQRRDGAQIVVRALQDNIIFNANGEEIGSAIELATEALRLEWLFERFAVEAHNHPERGDLKGFSVGIVLAELDYFLRDEADGGLDQILVMDLEGEFAFKQRALRFEEMNLADRHFGVAETEFMDRPTVWVQTHDDATQTTTFSWRTKEDKPLRESTQPEPIQSSKFVGLLKLERPAEWPPANAPRESTEPEAT